MERVPHQKIIPGTTFTVDCFQSKWVAPATTAHFLSHAHADHYGGLNERWEAGAIFCSEVTGALVDHMLGVDPQYIHRLPMDRPVTVQGVKPLPPNVAALYLLPLLICVNPYTIHSFVTVRKSTCAKAYASNLISLHNKSCASFNCFPAGCALLQVDQDHDLPRQAHTGATSAEVPSWSSIRCHLLAHICC